MIFVCQLYLAKAQGSGGTAYGASLACQQKKVEGMEDVLDKMMGSGCPEVKGIASQAQAPIS